METGRHKETLSACPLQQGNKERVGTPNFLCRKSKASKGASHRVASSFLWAADASANSKCGELIMAILDKVYGVKHGSCAWCLRKQATNSYIGVMTNGETVEYQVCNGCYKERV